MPNVNKLFPRLPIRWKLVIAFGLLVTVPLLVTGAFGTRETLHQIEAAARGTLDHELQTTSERTEHFLRTAEEDLDYLAETVLRPAAEGRIDRAALAEAVTEFLRRKPKFYQVRLFSAAGDPRFAARSGPDGPEPGSGAGGAYYAYRARDLKAGQNALLPVEIRANGEEPGRAIPALAVVYPLHDETGQMRGVAVGEVHAAHLFETIESGASLLGGAIGLVDADGQYLYHSERKRDWNTLLATRPDANLAAEMGSTSARTILAGQPGTLRVGDERLVGYRPLELAGPDGRPLFVYRSVPASVLAAPARRFLGVVGIGGFVVLVVAMALAVVAATQFTRPIYQLREQARKVAAGEFGELPPIETNDEIEELANDFGEMAERLREHRQHLEEKVTERTAALREAHAELEEILTHTDEAILRLDAHGHVGVWNRGAEEMFGYAREETIGRPLGELLGPPPGSGAEPLPLIAGPDGERTTFWRADGTRVEAGVSRSEIRDGAGEVLGYTVIIRDETRQRALERQMLRSERLAAAGRLAAGVVHEINNPIGIIVNRIDCLDLEIDERCGDACPVRSDLGVIRRQAERVGAVSRRLLTLAREESEVRERVDLNELVDGVIGFLAPELRKRELRLESDLDPGLPRIEAAPHGIETVLLNLVLNAIDATEPGGVIAVSTRPIPDGNGIELVVTDTGTGIPPEVFERVFEPFFTTKEKPRGTGLGLAVTQGVVQAHEGEIRVESEPGVGSRFTVSLPIGERRGA